MRLKDWQEKIVSCIAEGGWRSCPEDVRRMFDEIGLAHLDKYVWEGCRGKLCQAVTSIFLTDTRITLEMHQSKMQELPLPELRKQLRKNYEFYRYIVIGYDGNKLFVNLATSLDPVVKECTERSGIEVCRVERDFGYVDVDFEEVVVTPEMLQHGLPLRVQGDLVLRYIRKVGDLASVYLHARSTAVEAALRAIVELAFAEAGIAFELDPEGRYIVHAHDANEWGTYAIAHILHNVISRYVSAKLWENSIRLEFGQIEVTAYIDHYACTIHVFNDILRLNGVFKQFTDAYYAAIRGLQRTNMQMRIGNHLVEIRNTYPLSFTVPVELEIGGVRRTYLLTAAMEDGHFYADEKTEVTISHPEHGVTRVRFAVSGLYTFGHVEHRRDDVLSNTVIIRRTLRSMIPPYVLESFVYNWRDLTKAVRALGRVNVPVEIELKGTVEDTLRGWIKDKYGKKQISFDKDHVVVSDDENVVLIRYEVRSGKVVIKSFERP